MQEAESRRAEQIRTSLAAERQAITTLDGKLKDAYLKEQLRFAGHCLDDAEDMLAHAAKPTMPRDVSMWLVGAAESVNYSAQKRQLVQKAFDTYGPDVTTIG